MEQTFKERLLTLLFPHRCFLCGKALDGQRFLCESCALPVARADELCPCCGKQWQGCVCQSIHPAFSRVAVPFYYVGGAQRGMQRFKYEGRRYYAPFLAEQMQEAFWEAGGAQPNFVTFVPMHAKKQRERGYCPAEMLAREVAARLGVPVRDGFLLHTENAKAQMEQKGLTARLQNAAQSFARCGNAPLLSGEQVLLVDDILTTGATAHVCASLLRQCGAGEVWLAVAATTTESAKKVAKR